MNSKSMEIDKNGQDGKDKRKYRLNKRKFSVAMSVLCFIIAGIVIAVHYAGEGGREAIAAVNPPQKTTSSSPKASGAAAVGGGLDGKKVVVDAGHGGIDPGASGVSGSEEDDINLAVATFLKAELENKGADVVMTRSDENAIADTKDEDMEKRRVIIHDSGSDILVSVHMNSFGDESVSGPLVLFMPGSQQGQALAGTIQQCINDELEPANECDVRSDDLFVLRAGNMPSVLVECGFISNKAEEKKLLSEDYQKKVAKAICDGVASYFGN
jgi:N-acetylmuramoyl-L-alanine amidase